ncbi:hypothetical protein F4775DRAFT_606589 [Biscogniauxia sp. FL1348]|nr:hypothetical protein F4775DRAFT_606589 [Biscogniauxia sp. FL1348]
MRNVLDNELGNSLELKPSTGPLVVVLLYTFCDNLNDDNKVHAINKKGLDEIDNDAHIISQELICVLPVPQVHVHATGSFEFIQAGEAI